MKYSELAVVFATASPRRKALSEKIKYVSPKGETLEVLHSFGYSRVVPIFSAASVSEAALLDATECAAYNARLKGVWAADRTELPVFAFDTVVGKDGMVFGKPTSREEAVFMFEKLCGGVHEVITAVYFSFNGKIIEKSEKTSVTFGAFEKELVYNYVDSGAPFDKAGGYNIDDAAVKPLITGICGSYDNVVGLPVKLTEKLIEENLIYGENGHCR